jgi:hypothetical protein
MKTRIPIFFWVLTVWTLGLLLASWSVQGGQQPSGDKSKARVVMGGSGTEPQVQTAMDELADFLKSEGVTVQVEAVGKPRSVLTQQLKEMGGDSVLYILVNIVRGQRDKLTVQCFDAEGKKLWEEESAQHNGPFAVGGQTKISTLLEGILKKIKPRIGQPGLPK